MPPLVTRVLVAVLLLGALTGCLPTGSERAEASTEA
ncbi:MAG: hypothetical protein QOG76_1662, partial [Pseudonocardiales bacterium]|nr:hypothetical protein [Pseudonocardiales bacterium]